MTWCGSQPTPGSGLTPALSLHRLLTEHLVDARPWEHGGDLKHTRCLPPGGQVKCRRKGPIRYLKMQINIKRQSQYILGRLERVDASTGEVGADVPRSVAPEPSTAAAGEVTAGAGRAEAPGTGTRGMLKGPPRGSGSEERGGATTQETWTSRVPGF